MSVEMQVVDMELPGVIPSEPGTNEDNASAEARPTAESSPGDKLAECECRICLEPGKPMKLLDEPEGAGHDSAGSGPRDQPEPTALISPCICSGSLQWAHWGCIEQWVAERGSMSCEICGQPYKAEIQKLLRSSPRVAESNSAQETGWRIIREQAEDGTQRTLLLVGYFNNNDPQARWGTVPMIHEHLLAQQEAASRDRGAQNAEVDALRSQHRRKELQKFWIRNAVLLLLTISVLILLIHFGGLDDRPSFWILLLLRVVSFLLPLYLITRIVSSLKRHRMHLPR